MFRCGPLILGLFALAACERGPAPAGSPAPANFRERPPVAEVDHQIAVGQDLPGASTRLPLASILTAVQNDTPGEVIDVELDREDGIEVYEITVLTAEGRAIELTLDARNGNILEREDD